MAFKKTFSYAGFEMQRKSYEKPKIALLNIELELKAEKDNAEVIKKQKVEIDARKECYGVWLLQEALMINFNERHFSPQVQMGLG